MNVILLGPPGSGKGTQANRVCDALGMVQISTGDLLRSAVASGSALGKRVEQVMAEGLLVSDDIILDVLSARLDQPDCEAGCLFDGVPRTVVQAEGMVVRAISVDYVVELVVDEDEIVDRITGRLIHEPSGRIYHRSFKQPRVEGRDDVTGEPLVQRADDNRETVLERLQVYRDQTAPLLDYYRASPVRFVPINGQGSVDEIAAEIIAALREDG